MVLVGNLGLAIKKIWKLFLINKYEKPYHVGVKKT